MKTNRYSRLLLTLLLVAVAAILQEAFVSAQGASGNYRIDESFIGPGGALESGSTNYQFQAGQQATGANAIGPGSSTNYQAVAGAVTPSEPTLRCTLNTSSINFGGLSIGAATTATAGFSVLNYTSYGYNVAIVGATPSNGAHNLNALASNAASSSGTEQFGINLVANTSPTTFGANPLQVPDNTFSFGEAAANYNTANSYRYVNGENIATAPKSSGQTDYTISYIINIANTTPGGAYSGNQVIVCTGTY